MCGQTLKMGMIPTYQDVWQFSWGFLPESHCVFMLAEGHTMTLRNWIANKNCSKLRDGIFSQVPGGRKVGSQVGLDIMLRGVSLI